jgi:hypothetical protein
MRYFFDIDDGRDTTRDEIGYECSREELRRQAIAALPGLARDRLPNGDRHSFVVRVRDEGGRYVFQASLEFEARWLTE